MKFADILDLVPAEAALTYLSDGSIVYITKDLIEQKTPNIIQKILASYWGKHKMKMKNSTLLILQ